MAQLVKLKTRPQKYYYRRQEQIWPVNQIIGRQVHEQKLSIESSFHNFESRVNNTLRDFLTKWGSEIASANARGSIHRRQKILSEIITLALLWQRNIPQEVQALLILATKIANTILNTQIKHTPNQNLQDILTNNLKDFFRINILINKNIYSQIEIQSKPLDYFIPDSFLTIDNNKNPKITIFLNGITEEIELVGIDMRRMLSMAVKNISHSVLNSGVF